MTEEHQEWVAPPPVRDPARAPAHHRVDVDEGTHAVRGVLVALLLVVVPVVVLVVALVLT